MSLIKPITNDMVKEEAAPLWVELREKHAHKFDFSSDPDGIHNRINAIHHGMGILQGWEKHGGPAMARLRSFGVPLDTCTYLIKTYCEKDESIEEQEPVRKGTRANQYKDFERWAQAHEAEQFTTIQLAEQSGFSTATMRKYLRSSAHFIKIKSGLYECGNRRDQ